MFRLEQALLKTLEAYGVSGHRVRGEPGVYVRLDAPFDHAVWQPAAGADPFAGLAKIAAIGVKVSRHRTYHGVALNVAMDLRPFERIDPCGHAGLRTIDLSTIGVRATWDEVASTLGAKLAAYLEPVMMTPSAGYDATIKQKAEAKTSRIPIRIVPVGEALKKPDWIRVKAGSPSSRFYEIKQILREHKLHTVCEEASCPNIGECFGKGTATFMIMGDKCTRRCPFCDVGHGRPDPLDADEPTNLAKTIAALKLKYVVITSVDRDDLRDGGAGHFVACIEKTRELSPETQIEILTPDFRGRMDRALEILKAAPPDVMNHNLETAPRLYKEARPGSDYAFSLNLLKRFKEFAPHVPTKSGVMVGLGETDDEILQVMRDMRAHDIDMLTIGQYLAPSNHHLPVRRYVHPDTFRMYEREAAAMGFSHAAVGALVRSSYHADQQAHAAGVGA